MKNKILLTIILLLGMITSEINAQSMIIKMHDGIENTLVLNTIQKVNFSENDLVVVFKSGSNNAYDLSNVRKLEFNVTTSVDAKIQSDTRVLHAYPNPASTFITIEGIPIEAGFISIYKTDGQPALTEPVSSTTAIIDISSLQRGLYLLNALGHTIKFIKQ